MARALGKSICTVADDVEALRQQGREMEQFHFCAGRLVAILTDAPAPLKTPETHGSGSCSTAALQYKE